MEDNSVDCIITDPPYNIGIDKWDKIDDYINWLIKIFKECERIVKTNGTVWFFHMRFTVLSELHSRISKESNLQHKQLIIINKGIQSIAGRAGNSLRSYPRATEYLQFYTFEDSTGLSKIYSDVSNFSSIKEYLKQQKKQSGLTNKDFNLIFSEYTNKDGCKDRSVIEHYFGNSQWVFPTEELYKNVLQKTGFFKKPYVELKQEYKEYKDKYEGRIEGYESQRYTFNMESGVTDVWNINFYEDRILHTSPKPLKLMKRIVHTASKEGDIILDPFMGSGSTAVACQKLNRNFVGFELEQKYVDIANKRLQQHTLEVT
ncbi:MAG: DNA-methyltransferase [Candidatus Heimdallarchaeota archaeon]